MPADPTAAREWLTDSGRRHAVLLAVNLVPFAGIAFLWFIGAVRDRLGDREDRFFATVFLGSGLVFVAMMFAAAAVAGSLVIGFRGGVRPSAGAEVRRLVDDLLPGRRRRANTDPSARTSRG